MENENGSSAMLIEDSQPQEVRQPLGRRVERTSTLEETALEQCINGIEQQVSPVQERLDIAFRAATAREHQTRLTMKAQAQEALNAALAQAASSGYARAEAYAAHKRAVLMADAVFDASTEEPRHQRDMVLVPIREWRMAALAQCQVDPSSIPAILVPETVQLVEDIDEPVADAVPDLTAGFSDSLPTPSEDTTIRDAN